MRSFIHESGWEEWYIQSVFGIPYHSSISTNNDGNWLFIINRFKAFHIIMNFQKFYLILKGSFVMKEFQKLNEQEMKQLIGGYSSKDCLKDIGKGIGTGTVAGAAGGGLVAGLGAIPGAFVGAHFGVIGGSAACIGGLLGN